MESAYQMRQLANIVDNVAGYNSPCCGLVPDIRIFSVLSSSPGKWFITWKYLGTGHVGQGTARIILSYDALIRVRCIKSDVGDVGDAVAQDGPTSVRRTSVISTMPELGGPTLLSGASGDFGGDHVVLGSPSQSHLFHLPYGRARPTAKGDELMAPFPS
ncbi:hypothetical protein VM1G_05950 [Cytospora mali]|uniref:Uncharacterized protein n=1 Tax=Cytospora mali TaxID=578113 RepID=A0A194W1Y3_CYTMA|nr:hypothetical protein VM1G_05950 [Valsa mali]